MPQSLCLQKVFLTLPVRVPGGRMEEEMSLESGMDIDQESLMRPLPLPAWLVAGNARPKATRDQKPSWSQHGEISKLKRSRFSIS